MLVAVFVSVAVYVIQGVKLGVIVTVFIGIVAVNETVFVGFTVLLGFNVG